jgi:large subunit ribosomal protein L21
MYAIIEVGGKQYNVTKDDVIEVEKQRAIKDKEIALKNILLVSKNKKVSIGTPYVKEAKVIAVSLGDCLDKKKVCYKYRRRKSSDWKKGHRQQLTRLKIRSIDIA